MLNNFISFGVCCDSQNHYYSCLFGSRNVLEVDLANTLITQFAVVLHTALSMFSIFIDSLIAFWILCNVLVPAFYADA